MNEAMLADNGHANRMRAGLFEFIKPETTNPEGCSQ
jgi:hypothetical protein